MFYVYSTATSSIAYTQYIENSSKDLAVVKRKADGTKMVVTIKGGHGVATKHLFTPRGVVTEVTDEEMDLLLQDKNFQRHVKNGFMTYDKKEVKPEKKAAEMTQKDGSAPLTPQDFEESDSSSDEGKVYKKKGK